MSIIALSILVFIIIGIVFMVINARKVGSEKKEDGMLAKKFALGFGIAIIFPMMIHYGVSTFVPQPKWEDYRVDNYYERHGHGTPEEKKALETEQNRLSEEYEKKEGIFQKHLFFVAVSLGIIAIIVGSFLSVQAIGAGLMFGGIFSVCDGYINYWLELSDALRFLSLLVAFIVLLFVGYKKLEKRKPNE